ncbi:50S ribosomal protein L36 [Prodigiosinella confusarubida]|uniref:50S ribosomal protein L36 n=1 Tax=Serratia sp. (strain ATCC 39006) TaxID=104623 RepID=A0A2I5TDJ3_SERS3|nr:ribosomal protein bL36 [Serratia sp. ATCC 39006]AUH02602.1 50S ribosomal protein L36 [Serratia sp. ATCC 39006]AUH06916.1 50S ribosomal protein L36 [Serratia sp. ATCC 39006]
MQVLSAHHAAKTPHKDCIAVQRYRHGGVICKTNPRFHTIRWKKEMVIM